MIIISIEKPERFRRNITTDLGDNHGRTRSKFNLYCASPPD